MKIPRDGSKWQANDSDVFVVIHTVDLSDNIWVHYRKERTGQEFSCYLESFLARFREIPA